MQDLLPPVSLRNQSGLGWDDQVHDQAMRSANQLHTQAFQNAQQVASSMMQDAFQSTQFSSPAQGANTYLAPFQQYVSPMFSRPQQQQQQLQPSSPQQFVGSQDHAETQRQHQELLASMEKRYASQEQKFGNMMQGLQSDLQAAVNVSAQDRQAREGKDQEIAALQEKISQRDQAHMALQQRHSEEVARLAQTLASTPQPQSPAFDIAMLQQVIKEVQASQIKHADVQTLISNTVNERMSGLASKDDMCSAGAAVEKTLNRVGSDASEERIRNALEKGIDNFVDKRMRLPERKQQRIEEQHREAHGMQPAYANYSQVSRDAKKNKALTAPGTYAESSESKASGSSRASEEPYEYAETSIKKASKHSKYSADNANVLSTLAEKGKAPVDAYEVDDHSEAMSSVSTAKRLSGTLTPSDSVSMLSTSSKVRSSASRAPKRKSLAERAVLNRLGHTPMLAICEGGSGVGSTVSSSSASTRLTKEALDQLPSKQSSKSGSRSRVSVPPSRDNAIVRMEHGKNGPRHNAARSAVSAQPSRHNAMVWPPRDADSQCSFERQILWLQSPEDI